jgi:hypothetical protein
MEDGILMEYAVDDPLAHQPAEFIVEPTLKLKIPELTEEEKLCRTLEYEKRLAGKEGLEKVRRSITGFGLKVLELRSRGYSPWAIALELEATVAKVRHSLQKLAQIPEYRDKLGEYMPKPRKKS